jgi:hypothetical protein
MTATRKNKENADVHIPRSQWAGRQAEDPENKLRLLAVRPEANYQLMKTCQTY